MAVSGGGGPARLLGKSVTPFLQGGLNRGGYEGGEEDRSFLSFAHVKPLGSPGRNVRSCLKQLLNVSLSGQSWDRDLVNFLLEQHCKDHPRNAVGQSPWN